MDLMNWKDFVVGKKYQDKNYNKMVYECILSEPENQLVILLDRKNHASYVVHAPNKWEEVKELKTGSFWINVYPCGISYVHSSREKADEAARMITAWRRLACIEVKWTEGQGLEDICCGHCTSAGGQPCNKKGCKA